MAMEANHAGDFFPIWGTCLGMEMLGLITTGGQEYLTRWRQQHCWKQLMENPNIRCTSYGSLPLELSEGWENSQLYGSALIMIFLLQINWFTRSLFQSWPGRLHQMWSTSWLRCPSPSTGITGVSPTKTSQRQFFSFTMICLIISSIYHKGTEKIDLDHVNRFGMDAFWTVLSENSDPDGIRFISTLEAKDYPFYAIQVLCG